jgi:hypothetical protein
MKLICSRTISFLDVQSFAPREAKEALFRDENGFVLYLSDGAQPPALQERLISLDAREALLWLNETPSGGEPFWI